jgi:nitric oxide reductase NorE protein
MSDRPAFLRDRPAPLPAVAAARPATAATPAPAKRIPGEAGLWVLLLGDMTVFALFFGAFLVTRGQHPAEFAASRTQLTIGLGAANTVALLTSSLLVARAVRAHREGRGPQAARRLIAGAGLCALVFATIKGLEWGERLHAGDTPASSDFFMFYFAITAVHFLHLLIGVALLGWVWRIVGRPGPAGARERLIVECGASYWHMVDLLWIVIFPLLYLAST